MLTVPTAGAFAALGHARAACGVLVAAAWVFLNSFFLFELFQMGLDPALPEADSRGRKGGVKDRVLLFSILKFPVLYLAGFFVLWKRFFPVSGILAGLTAFVAAFFLTWMRFNSRKAAL